MTHGTIAGLLLRDLILGRENPWAKLYNVAAQYADWLTAGDAEKDTWVPRGCGAV